MIFKNFFKCQELPIEEYLSFELQIMRVEIMPLICALAYLPPKQKLIEY